MGKGNKRLHSLIRLSVCEGRKNLVMYVFVVMGERVLALMNTLYGYTWENGCTH